MDAAKCVNHVHGYACECFKGTFGDGFAGKADYWETGDWRTPQGYVNASGCADLETPSLALEGPDPVVFKTEPCRGERLSSLLGHGVAQTPEMSHDIATQFEEFVKSSPGALCGRSDPWLCVAETDFDAVSGKIVALPRDSIALGQPRLKTARATDAGIVECFFLVPYSVADAAGNVAVAEQKVVVREISLAAFEAELRLDSSKLTIRPEMPTCIPCPSCMITECNIHGRIEKTQDTLTTQSICDSTCVESLTASLEIAEKRLLRLGVLVAVTSSVTFVSLFTAANTRLRLATLNGHLGNQMGTNSVDSPAALAGSQTTAAIRDSLANHKPCPFPLCNWAAPRQRERFAPGIVVLAAPKQPSQTPEGARGTA